jgi:peptidoglycan L-alanyl-D-glutamate endopeptidase CwlK
MNERSRKALKGVHQDLVRVTRRAAELVPGGFIVTEGLRTVARQRELMAKGASRTMRSRHLTGHAIDFVPVVGGRITWKWPAFEPIAQAFKAAARELNVAIVWGGDWKTFKDGPHIELDRRHYP